MLRRNYLGAALSLVLPKDTYKGYVVDCIYKFDKQTNKYKLSMWLRRLDIDDRLPISSQEISSQMITSDKDHIIEDIERIVEQAANTRFFDKYVGRYEYYVKCFNYGNNHYETLRNTENGEHNL